MAHLRDENDSEDRPQAFDRRDKHVELSEQKGYVEGPEANIDPDSIPLMGMDPVEEDDSQV